MAIKFANILAALGMGSKMEAVTEAHLEAADAKIAQLEQAKLDADAKVTDAEAALKTATEEKTKVAGELKEASDKVATLEDWKKQQATVDGREEDDSNSLDKEDEGPKASWEVAAAMAVATAKKRVGEK